VSFFYSHFLSHCFSLFLSLFLYLSFNFSSFNRCFYDLNLIILLFDVFIKRDDLEAYFFNANVAFFDLILELNPFSSHIDSFFF